MDLALQRFLNKAIDEIAAQFPLRLRSIHSEGEEAHGESGSSSVSTAGGHLNRSCKHESEENRGSDNLRLDKESPMDSLLDSSQEEFWQRVHKCTVDSSYDNCLRRKLGLQMEEDEHKDRQLLIQFDELVMKCESREGSEEWRQAGRWIRYEEAVEVGAERFGKPRLSSLSFHALLELRHCFEIGAVILDLILERHENFFERIVSEMLRMNALHRSDQDRFQRILKLPHRHTYQQHSASTHKSFLPLHRYLQPGVENNNSELGLTEPRMRMTDKTRVLQSRGHTIFPREKNMWNSELLKRLSPEAEAASVQAGSSARLNHTCIAFVRFHRGTYIEGQVELPLPLRYFFVIVGPITPNLDFHEIGRSLCTLLANRQFRDACAAAENRNHIMQAINDFLDESMVVPPGEWERDKLVDYDLSRFQRVRHRSFHRRRALATRPIELDQYLIDEEKRRQNDPLRRTGVLFGGVRREIKKRYPHYLSDISDAFNLQSVRCVIFIFLTCFFPALTFGAILHKSTSGQIGMTETLLATSLLGVAFALFSTQPIIITGVVGSMLIFEESLYAFSSVQGFPYLTMRFWVSIWAFLFSAVMVCFEGSLLIRHVTRFTDDILSALISVIFFSECFRFISSTFRDNPLMTAEQYCNSTISNGSDLVEAVSSVHGQPNTALLSTLFTAATFLVAFGLRRVRNSRYFGRQVRRALGDFGLSISVVVMVMLDNRFIRTSSLTNALNIRVAVKPSLSREWIVNVWEWETDKVPLPLAAILPGFLLFFLLFTETLVCEMMLLSSQLQVKKGTGYHFDLLLSGALLVISALFGLPWLCAASMRTTAHTHSLTLFRLRAPGQKPRIVGLREQRITAIALHALIGLTLLFPDVLKAIPLSVLFGAFLYLGVMNLTSSHMLSRSILFFVPVKYHPSAVYCLRVRTWRMHLFTGIQLVCFVLVCAVKSNKSTAFAFPLALLMAVGVRQLVLPRVFSTMELLALDGAEEEPQQDVDFYEDSRAPALSSYLNGL